MIVMRRRRRSECVPGIVGVLSEYKKRTAVTLWVTAVSDGLAEREAPEPMLSENIIKLQITDNHILYTMQSKSKSF